MVFNAVRLFFNFKNTTMEDMINLSDLLKHEILDLYSAEEQIIDALPAMIEKASNGELKKALRQHLEVTKEQRKRLDQVKEWMGEGSENGNGKNKGFFSRMFSGNNGPEGEKCKAMEGLIAEGEKMMSADASEEVCDAAIIASAQKIEHYEISGYGTARTYARELQLEEVARLLEQTLNEEYQADDLLTKLATGRINLEAEAATEIDDNRSARTSGGRKSASSTRSSSSSRVSSRQGSEKGSGSERSKSSSNGKSTGKSSSSNNKSNSSAKNSSNKNGSSKSNRSATSTRSGTKSQSSKNKKGSKRSSTNNKKERSKSGASR